MTTRSNSEQDSKVKETSLTTVAISNDAQGILEDNDNSLESVDSELISLYKNEESATDPTFLQTDDGPTTQRELSSSAARQGSGVDSISSMNDHNGDNNNIDNDENDLIPFAQNMNTEAMAAATYPFSFSQNLIPSVNHPPTRKLSFEDDHQPFGLPASPVQKQVTFDDEKPHDFTSMTAADNISSDYLTCQENQDFGSPSPPAPVGLDSIFPTTYMDEMSTFPTLQQSQYLIDDSYSNNLLGCAFIPSPRQDPETSSLSNSNAVSSTSLNPFAVNINDIRAQYHGPTLGNTFSNHFSSQHLMNPLPSLHGHGYNDNDEEDVQGDEEDNGGKKSMGKSLLNLSQISASVDRSSRSKRPRARKMSRNLPLRKRHPSLTRDQQSDDVMTTPINTTRQTNTRHLVSRSASTEKKKKSVHTKQQLKLKCHRKVSGRSSKPFPRTATTSDGRFKLLPKPENMEDGATRVIQHFVPKRHTVPILSSERSLPNTVIFGCKCTKSKCLKLYCDCFQAGQVCSDRCGCQDCLNTVEESGKGGARTVAIQSILDRRPDAFDVRTKRTGEGCSCKKNRCLKKYCDCFSSGVKCDPDKCRCVDCHNYPTDNEQEGDESSVSVVDEKDEIDYNNDEENTNMSDYQTPFEQDEDEFILTVPPLRNNVLDEKPFVFQEDVTAI